MRISTSYQFDTYSEQMRAAQEKYLETQKAVMSGKRINTLSDDPFGAATSLNLRSLESGANQYIQNLTTGKGVLTYSEAALGDSNNIMTQAYQIAVSAANSSTDQGARNAMASQIGDMEQQLLQYANAKGPSGQYIFGGQNNAVKPFTITTTPGPNAIALASGTYLNFAGDNLDVTIETGPAEEMSINSKGQNLFGKAYQALDQLKIDLQGGNVSSISGVDIQQVQNAMDAYTTERGYVGTKLQSVQTLTDNYNKRVTDLKGSVSDIEDVDLSAAIEKYTLAQTAYQAALSVASQGYRLSLLNFIGTGTA